MVDFTLLRSTPGDLLENYCYDDMNLARVLFCVSILLTFPLECFVSREVTFNIIQEGAFVAKINASMAFTTQIIKTQIKRFYSHEIVEYDKNVDPRNKEDSEDKVIIALMWVFADELRH